MKRFSFTIGTRLLGAFGAVFALTLALLALYVSAGRDSSRQLDTILRLYNRKLAIGLQVKLATAEMRGAQRGLTLSYAMHDPGTSLQYIQLYQDSGTEIDRMLAELEPLLSTDVERNAMAEIEENRRMWKPRFQQLIEICQSGDVEQAYKLRNENKLISAKMFAAATDLADRQQAALVDAGATASARMSRANRIALLAMCFSVAFGIAVLAIVRKATLQFRRAIAGFHEGVSQVARASGQVSASSQGLAQGATEQAAAIEETSASTEEINAMTQQNADHSRQAAELIARTSEAVGEANDSLDEMHVSMREINDASGQIRRIIRVIEEIAFQTNILALNAAVEAARAGEAGQGFAVVADEVRNLAHRSAQAAQDTARLIEESAAKAGHGRLSLDRVLAAIGKITGAAADVRRLIDGVKAGNEEQARGIRQIAQAISQMQEVTQKTAATAEQTASAGAEMNAQARTLDAIVGQLHALVG